MTFIPNENDSTKQTHLTAIIEELCALSQSVHSIYWMLLQTSTGKRTDLFPTNRSNALREGFVQIIQTDPT